MRKDVSGQKFGKLTAIRFHSVNNGNTMWLFSCECGKEKVLIKSNVCNGNTKSCGCVRNNYEDITGKKFGRLIALKRSDRKEVNRVFWDFKCDCGNEVTCSVYSVKSGHTNSCGCFHSEKMSKVGNNAFRGYEQIGKGFWSTIINGAKIRGIDFNLTMEFAWDLFLKQNKKCAISGVEISLSRTVSTRTKMQTASLDRKDSKKGYTEDNVWWVHKEVNQLKWDLPLDELVKWCNIISSYNKQAL